MAKLSKRVKAFRERVDANKSYPLDEAIAILKETATAKFNESVEVAVNLGVDARKSDQGVRGATTLPHGTGSEVRVVPKFIVIYERCRLQCCRVAVPEQRGFKDIEQSLAIAAFTKRDDHSGIAYGVHGTICRYG